MRRFGEHHNDGVSFESRRESSAKEVAKGQKSAIYAIALNVIVVATMVVLPSVGVSDQVGTFAVLCSWVLIPVAFVMSVYGMIKIGSGLGWSIIAKIFILVLLFIPVVSLITVLVLNSKATSYLRDSGYKVGLLGAYQ